ncbi:PREDICTED: mas-related G-protein coupled receptor member A2-like [Thamnophis sirtalis]|uniref:Mas-related G-protein coupled receptor member A2-like n=1 Tax=Thamnophis sirtalis TaxID=35019 RepID=A0A6I9YMS6_9SAUR|nr:PREDICTED: mas-related G-protein coupled receptor member A2-like [Thamnophis sirtalis]
MLFCVLGMLGNGLVIWLLGSSIKRNTFAIYFLNLSVADFGFLTFEMIIEIHGLPTNSYCGFPYEYFQMVVLLMHSTGQFLLTVISIDRCLSVLFPIWYRCHRPVHMFTNVCAVIWVISFILSSINLIIVAVALAFPLNVFYFNLYFSKVGRQKGETQRSIKELLQIVFKEEENCSDQTETSEGSKI